MVSFIRMEAQSDLSLIHIYSVRSVFCTIIFYAAVCNDGIQEEKIHGVEDGCSRSAVSYTHLNVRKYTYNAGGKVTGLTDFDGKTVSFDYNDLGKISAYTVSYTHLVNDKIIQKSAKINNHDFISIGDFMAYYNRGKIYFDYGVIKTNGCLLYTSICV